MSGSAPLEKEASVLKSADNTKLSEGRAVAVRGRVVKVESLPYIPRSYVDVSRWAKSG
jgi:metal-dependent HD superfamily phosphatase/phosphodiesterase